MREIFELRSDPVINKYLDRKPCKSPDDALIFIRNIIKNELLYWAITLKPYEKLTGTICLFDISDEKGTCEIGYELLTDHQGHGIMNEAAHEIKLFAFDVLGLKTIDASVHIGNSSSIKLLQKFNFVKTDITDSTNPDLIVFRLSNAKTK